MVFSPGGNMSPALSGTSTPTEMLSPRPPNESPKRSHQYARAPDRTRPDIPSERDCRDNETIAVAVAAAMKAMDNDANANAKTNANVKTNATFIAPLLSSQKKMPLPVHANQKSI